MNEDIKSMLKFYGVILATCIVISLGLGILNLKLGIVSFGCSLVIIPILFLISYLKFFLNEEG